MTILREEAFVRTLTVVLLLLLLSSCSIARHPAGIAPSTAPIFGNYTVLGPAAESSCSYSILLLPIGSKDQVEEIIDRLVKEKGGDAMIGVTVEYKSSWFALPLFGNACTIVNGSVVRIVK